jgi:hypothetical protein
LTDTITELNDSLIGRYLVERAIRCAEGLALRPK